MISNVSFVVIARNEVFALTHCLNALAAMPLENCEVICIDSASTDSTQQVMLKFRRQISNLKVIHCQGFLNASVARNAGMPYATKKYIFFVDGDVSLSEGFLRVALDRIKADRADAVTGRLHEIQYTPSYENVIRELTRRRHIRKEKPCLMTGGIFLARRDIVAQLGSWDTRMWRLQDFDYTLRLTRQARLLQLPCDMGTHHTLEYLDRSWEHFFKGYPRLYGWLIRQNIDRSDAVWALLRGNRGLLTFLLLIFSLTISGVMGCLIGVSCGWVLIFLVALVTLDASYSLAVKREKFLSWIRHNYLEPPLIMWGILSSNTPAIDRNTTTEIEVVL